MKIIFSKYETFTGLIAKRNLRHYLRFSMCENLLSDIYTSYFLKIKKFNERKQNLIVFLGILLFHRS